IASVGGAASTPSKPKVASVKPVAKPVAITKEKSLATQDKPFENSLGMRFVPVPITGGPSNGKRVLFSIWETRVKDYEVFIKENLKIEWSGKRIKQQEDHPAVFMTWQDAVGFCKWLTVKARKGGKLSKDEAYRLPTDHEWSCAVGIGELED
ncbi:unnamed protein product, partial [marine sediment metagenome]